LTAWTTRPPTTVSNQFRTSLGEVLEVRRGPRQVLPRAVEPQPLVAVVGTHHADPAAQVLDFLAEGLREQVVGDPDGQLAGRMEVGDRAVARREVLESADGVDQRRQPEPVQLQEELPGGALLAFRVQDRGLGQGRVQQQGARRGDEHLGGFAVMAADDLAARRAGVSRVIPAACSAARFKIAA
jgi:hypothetical protein